MLYAGKAASIGANCMCAFIGTQLMLSCNLCHGNRCQHGASSRFPWHYFTELVTPKPLLSLVKKVLRWLRKQHKAYNLASRI